MSYVDDNLMSGEKVIYCAKLHWAVYLGPVVFIILTFFLIFLGGDAAPIGAGIFLPIAFFWGIRSSISRKTSEFGITNMRVMIKVGLIMRNSQEILLKKVEGIQVNQGIIGRILDYGTIIIKGTGGTSNTFNKISSPLEFRRKVQEQIDSIEKLERNDREGYKDY